MRLGHEDAPQVQRLVVAALQQHDAAAAALGEGGVAVELPAGRGVELVEVAHAEGLGVRSAPSTSSRCSISMPKGVPQSPMWFSRRTSWPRKPRTRASASPMSVRAQVADVHLLGHVGRRVVDDHRLGVRHRRRPRAAGRRTAPPPAPAMKSSDSVRLMKPGPLTSTSAQMSSREAAATTSSATSRGGRPSRLARGRAPLAWKSARSEARRTGSAPGDTVSKAAWSRCRRTLDGVGHPSFSHARAGADPGGAGARAAQSAGAPMAPSISP